MAPNPTTVQRSYASQLKEHEPLFNTYEHLSTLPRGDAALQMLRQVASIVKPIMRKHGWRVQILAEFLPAEANLLGLNINSGHKICLRLRYPRNPDLFLPKEQVVDTLLHELAHNVWGEHDSNFHKLWDALRDEHEVLAMKGYTGEGFLTEGRRLGGGRRPPPPDELRRLARASAEDRKKRGALTQGSGQKLGGTPLHLYGDVRAVIAEQATRRNAINRGCASGRQDAGQLSQQSAERTFKTKAEEDDANNRAIAQALYELMEQEETQKLNGTFSDTTSQGGLAWDEQKGLYESGKTEQTDPGHQGHPSEEDQLRWAMEQSMQSSSSTPQPSASINATPAPPVPLDSKPRPQPTQTFEGVAPGEDPKPRGFQQDPPTTQSADLIDLTSSDPAEEAEQWTCNVCTCINPVQFLTCDACGVERPQKPTQKKPTKKRAAVNNLPMRSILTAPPPRLNETLGWNCGDCGAFMEHQWWTCSACGRMKASS